MNLSAIKDIQQFVDEISDTEIYDNRERGANFGYCRTSWILFPCNYQEQWYSLIHEAVPDKLILGTELYQYFMGEWGSRCRIFTEKNPSLIPFENHTVLGGMIWTGYDYPGESMGYPAKGWGGALIRTNMSAGQVLSHPELLERANGAFFPLWIILWQMKG